MHDHSPDENRDATPHMDRAESLSDQPFVGRGGPYGTLSDFKKSVNTVVRDRNLALNNRQWTKKERRKEEG
jgi:hypothetical protein